MQLKIVKQFNLRSALAGLPKRLDVPRPPPNPPPRPPPRPAPPKPPLGPPPPKDVPNAPPACMTPGGFATAEATVTNGGKIVSKNVSKRWTTISESQGSDVFQECSAPPSHL